MSPRLKRLLKWSAVASGALLLLVAATLYTVANTGFGLNRVAAWVGDALSNEELTIQIAAVEGRLGSAFTIDSITISDKTGVFAEAHDISLNWRPWALWSKTLHLQSLSVSRLKFDRLPATASKAEADQAPIPPIGLRVEAITVSEIAVGPSLFGRPQQSSLRGAAEFDPSTARASLDLDIDAVDGGGDSARIRLGYAVRPARFVADIRIVEPTGGLIAHLAGLPPGERFFVSLDGTGQTDRWQGKLKIESGAVASANADVTVALKDAVLDVGLSGAANILPFAPAPLHPFLGPTLDFRADATLQKLDRLALRNVFVSGEKVTLEGHAGYGLADGSLTAEFTVDMTAPANAAHPGFNLAQSRLEAKIEGSIEAPQFDLSLRSGALAFDALRLQAVKGTATVRPVPSGAYRIDGALRGEGFDPGLPLVKGLLGKTLEIDVSGTLTNPLSGSEATVLVKSGRLKAEVASRLTDDTSASTRATVSVGSIGPLFRNIGYALDGAALAEATVFTDLSAGAVSATISGAFTGLTGGDPALAPILGDRVPFSGAADWRFGSPIEIIGFDVSTAAGRLRADGKVDLETDGLSANIDLAVPALSPLSQTAGMTLGGSAIVTAAVTGSFDSLTARGQAQLQALRVDGTAIGDVGAGYTTRFEPGAISASLRLGGEVQGKSLAGTFDTVLQNNAIELSNIDIAVGDNKAAGAIGIKPAEERVSGKLLITLNSIAELPGAARSGLDGRAQIQLDADRNHDLDITVRAEALRIGPEPNPQAKIGSASAEFRIRSPLSQPRIAGRVNGEKISAAGVERGTATLELDGTLSKLAWQARAVVPEPRSGTLNAAGEFAQLGDAIRLSVEKLNGDAMNLEMALASPFDVTIHPSGWQVTRADIQIAGGRAQITGSLDEHQIDAALTLENLPLGQAALLDPRIQIEGALNGRWRMTGPPDRPKIDGSLSINGLRPKDLSKDEFAGFDAKLAVSQTDAKAQIDFSLAGPTDTRVAARLSAPPFVRLGATPDTDISEIPIEGEFRASGRLDLIDHVIGLGEDRLDGTVNTDATFSGTIGNPVIKGDLRLAEGSYEGAALGTLLRNIAAHIEFTGRAARIVSLKMDDGDKGQLSGSGSLDFANVDNPSGGFELAFSDFTALRHPLAEMTTSGKLALTGSFTAPRLVGKLRVDKGEIRIPDALPESVIALDVEEINGGAQSLRVAGNSAEPAASDALEIALGIDIEIPGQTFVRGRGLDSEWKGALAISGTSRAPAIAGKLQAVRGTFAFAGKTFFIKNGAVFFPGGKAVEPEIDAVAEAKLSDIVARVGISGTVSKPSIGVSSEPPLPQEDVLSQILFGQTAGQLSPLQAAQLAQSAATLSGVGGTSVVDKVRQALGVDVLNVESAGGDSRGASLKAGKYITDDVFVSVTQGTTPGSQKVGVEVQVLPNITVESNVSGEADSNIGVNWKWDY